MLTHPWAGGHWCGRHGRQIQLLVSADEVENYRDIKEAMDALRLVVESKLDRVVQLRTYATGPETPCGSHRRR